MAIGCRMARLRFPRSRCYYWGGIASKPDTPVPNVGTVELVAFRWVGPLRAACCACAIWGSGSQAGAPRETESEARTFLVRLFDFLRARSRKAPKAPGSKEGPSPLWAFVEGLREGRTAGLAFGRNCTTIPIPVNSRYALPRAQPNFPTAYTYLSRGKSKPTIHLDPLLCLLAQVLLVDVHANPFPA